MSTLSQFETNTTLKPKSDESLFRTKKINKIKKSLLNLEKEELSKFSSLKVKIYKDEVETQKEECKIKVPEKFKNYFEDFRKFKWLINQIESGIITPSSGANSIKAEQVDSSDLVNSE